VRKDWEIEDNVADSPQITEHYDLRGNFPDKTLEEIQTEKEPFPGEFAAM